jgi:hypothetical protein
MGVLSDSEIAVGVAIVAVGGYLAYRAYVASGGVKAAATAAAQQTASFVDSATTGTVSDYNLQQMDTAQAQDIIRAGGTQKQAAASVKEMNDYVANNYPALSLGGSIANAWQYWAG